ncbi:hypothetical protein AVEN_182443-1 [Araneus ventricosus]|uniref:VWFC domain-containing protein n=1 Tax=Araneus ventricosus TaxID=182803 RepID=A0A4Y2K230_ARAVE|nr:hypothetical protein AVEN_182443-1 [Araneus ventricosus]
MAGEHVPSTPSDVKEITEKAEAEITTVSAKDFTEAAEKPVSLTSVGVEKTTQEAEIEKAVVTSATPIKESEFTVTTGEPVSSTLRTKMAEAEITTTPVKDFTEATEKAVSLTSVGVEKTTQEIEVEKAAETSVTPIKELEFTVTTGKPVSSTLSDEHKVTEEEEAEATRGSVEFTEEPEKTVSSTYVSVEKTTQQAEIEKASETPATPIKEFELTTSTGEPKSSTASDVKEITEKAEAEITTVPAKDFTEATEKVVSLTSVGVEKATQEPEIEKAAETSVTPIKELESTVTTGKPVSSTLSDDHKVTEEEETKATRAGVEFTEEAETAVALTSVTVEKTTQEAEIEKAGITSATSIKEFELTTTTGEPASSTRSDVKEITEKAEAEITTVPVKETTEKDISLISVGVELTTLEPEIEKAVETSATPIKESELSSTTSEYVSSTPSHAKTVTESAEAEQTTAPEEEFTAAFEKAVSQTFVGVEKTTQEAEIEKAADTSVTPITQLEFTVTTGKPVSSTPTDVKELTEKAEGEITTVVAKDFTGTTEKTVSFTTVGVEKTTQEAEIEKAVETSATPVKELETVTTSKAISSTLSDVEEITEMAEAEKTTTPGEELIEVTEKSATVSPTGEAKTKGESTIAEVIKTSATPLKEFEFTVTSGKPISSTPSGEDEITEKEEAEQTTGTGEFVEEKEISLTPSSVAVEQTTPQAEVDKASATSVTALEELESTATTGKPVPLSTSGAEEITKKAEVEVTTVSAKELSEATEKAASLTSIDVVKTTQEEAEIEKAGETSATTIKELKFTITTSEPYSSTPSGVEEISEKIEGQKTEETSTGPSREFTEATEKAVSLTSVDVEKTTLEAEIEKAVETSATPIKELEFTVTTGEPVSSTPSIIEEITKKAEAEMSTVTAKVFSETTEKAISLTSVGEEKTTQEADIEKAVETSSTPVKELEFTVTTSEPLSSTPSGIEEISEKAEGVKTEETSTGLSREFTEATEKAVSLTSAEVDKTTIEAEIEKAGKTSTTIKESEFTVTTGKPVSYTTSGAVEITEKAEAEETTAPGEELTEATEKAITLTSIGVEKTTQESEIEKAVETSATPLKELKATVTTGKAISSIPSGVEEITEKLEEEETSAPADRRTTPVADKSTEHFTTVSSKLSTPVEETDSGIITDHFSVETGTSFDVLDLKKVTETTSFSEGTKTSIAVSDEISLTIPTTEIPVSKHVTEKESLTTSSADHVSEIDGKRESVIPVSEGLPQTTSATGAEEEAKFTTSATTTSATSEKEIEAEKKTSEGAQSGLADVSMTTALAIENQTVFSTTTSTITMSDTSIKTEFTLTTLPTFKFEDITESIDEALESQTTILVPDTVETGEAELSTSADKVTPTDHIERDSKIPVITTEVSESTPEKSDTLAEETITKSSFETSEVTEKLETKELPVSKVTSTESTTVKTTPERLPTMESSTLFDLSQISERDESKISAETEKAEDTSPPLRATTLPDVDISSPTVTEMSKASDLTTSSEGEETKATTAPSDVKITDQISTLGADKTDLSIESSTPGIKDLTTDIKFDTIPTEISSTVTKSSELEAQTSEKPEDKVSTEHILADKTVTTEPQAETSSLITDITLAKEVDVSEKAVTKESTVESVEKISTVAISTKVPEIEKTEGASGITEFGLTPTSTPMKISSEFEGTTAERGAEEAETTISDRVTLVTDKSIELSTESKLTSSGEDTTESTILSDTAAPKATTISEKSTPSVTTLVSDLSTLSEETDVVSDETTKLEITSIEGMKTSESIDMFSITDSQKTTAESKETTGSLEVKDFTDQPVKPDSLLTTKETEHSVTPVSAVTETTEIEQQAEVSEKTTLTTSEAPKITEFKMTSTSETSKITTESTDTKLTTSMEERDEESGSTPSKVSEEAEPEKLFTKKPITEEFSVTGTDATFIPSKITLTTSKEEVSGDTSKEGETRFTTVGTEKTPEKLSSAVTTSILSTESTTISDETLAKQTTKSSKVFADEKATTIETDFVSKSFTTETPEEKITEQKELGEKDTKSTSLLTTSATDAFSETDLLESTTMSTTFKPDITTEMQELAKTTAPSTVSLKTSTSTLSTKSEFTEEIATKLPSETIEGEKFAGITTPAPSEKAASTEEVKDSEITTELAATTSKEETSTLSTKYGFTEDTVVASKQTETVKPSEISTVSGTEFTPTAFETFDKTTHVKTTGSEAEEVSHVEVASTISVSEVDKETSKVTEFSTSGITSAPAELASGIVSTKLFEKELTTLQGHEAETTTSLRPEKPVSVTGVPPVKETTISSETTLEAEIGTEAHVTEGKTISDISSTVSSSEITATTSEDLTMLGKTSVSKETTPAETDAFGEKQKETTGIEAVTKVTSLEEEAATTVSIDFDKKQLTTKETLEPKITPSTIEAVKTSKATVEPKTSTSTFDLKATTTSETKRLDEKELSTPKVLDAEFSTLKPEHTSESVDLLEKYTVTTPRTLTTESEDLSKTETSIIVEDTIQSNRTFAVDSMVVAHSTTPISESTTEAAEIIKEKTSAATTLHDKFDVSEDLLSITKSITDTSSDLLHVTTQKGLSETQTFEGSTIKVTTTIPEKEASTTEKLEEAFEGQTTLKEEAIQTVSTAFPSTPTDKAFSTEIEADIGKVSTKSTDVELPVEKAETGTESPSEIAQTPVITKEPSSIQAGAQTTTFGPITEGREMKTTPFKVSETPQSTEESPLLTATTSVTEKVLEAEVTTHAELETPSVSPKKGEEDTTIEAHKETTSQTSFEFETTKEPRTPLSVESATSEKPSLISKDISEKTTIPEELFTGKASATIKEITETVPESSSISSKEEAEDHGDFSTVTTEERTSPKSTLGTKPSVDIFETSTFISIETIKPDLETATLKESEKSPQPETPSSLTDFAVSSSTHATTTSSEKEATGIESQEGEEKQVETSSILDESLISSTAEAKITSQPPGPVTESTSSTATTTPETATEASTHLAGKAGVTALDETEAKSTTARISTEDIGEEEDTTPDESDCFINGTSYSDGEPILTVEPCEKCHCASGEIICFKIVCKIPKRGCVPDEVNGDECCPTSYKCPTEEDVTEIVTAGASHITEKDLSTPIPISFMFSTMPTSISTAILTSKTVEEEKEPADEEAASTEIPSSSTLRIAESTSLASVELSTVESSVGATASTAGASEGILDTSGSPSTFKTIEITTESSRSIATATTSESIPEIKTEKSASEVEPEVTVKEISEIATKSTDEGRIEEFVTTPETGKQFTKEESSETELITEKRRQPAITDEEEITTVSFTAEEKKLTTPISTTGTSNISEFTSTPLTDVKAKEVGLEVTTGEPSFNVETKSVEPALTGEEEKTTEVSFTAEGKKVEITTPSSTSSSTVIEFTSTPLTDAKPKEVGLEVTTEEPLFDVETKSVELALTGEEEKTTEVSFTTEGKKVEITTPSSSTSSSTVIEFTSTPLTDVKSKEVGLEVTTGEPSFDVETKSVEPALTGEEEKTTEVSFTTDGKKVEITTPSSTTSSSTVSEFTSTRLADEKVKEVGLEITTEKPFFDVKTIPTETSLAESEVTTLEERGSTPPKPIVTEELTTPEELKFVTDQITTIAKDELKPISTTEIPETSSSSFSSISDEGSAETTTSGKLYAVTKEQPSDMTTKSEVDKFTGTEPTVTDKISLEEKSTGIVHDVTESTVFTSESGEISSVDIKEIEAKSTATTLESKLSSISFESTVESRGAETTLSVESSTTTKAPASDVTSKFEVTDEFKETEAAKKETTLPVEELSTEEKTSPTTEIKSTRESTESSAIELMADKSTKTPSTASEETKAEGTTPFPESSMPTISSVSPAFTTEERFTETEELGISSKEPTVELETKSAATEKSKAFETTTQAKISAEEEVRTESELAIGVTEETPLTTEVADIGVTASKAEAEVKAETTYESGTSTISSFSSLSTSPEKSTEMTGEVEVQSTEKALSEITTKSAEAEKVTRETAFTEKISTLEPGRKTTVTSEAEAEVTEAVLSDLTTKSEEVEKVTLETAFTEKISTSEPGIKTTAISEESTVSHKGTEITGEAEAEVTESVLSELTTKSEEVEKVTQERAFTESISTLEPGKKTTAFGEEKDKSLSTVEADEVTTMPAVSEKEDEVKVTTVVPEAVTSPVITVTSKFISDSLKTSETKEFDLTTSTEAAEIPKETQKVEEVESTTKTTGVPDTEKLSHSTTLKPEETTKIPEVMSSTSLPAKLPKLEDSITSTVRIPVDKSTSTEKVETTMSTLKVEDIDIVTEEKHILEDQATTMHAEYASEESVTVSPTEFKPAKLTTYITEAPELLAETSTSTSGEDLSGIGGKVTDGTKFPSDISLKLTTLSETISTEMAINDTALFKTERPSPSLPSTLQTLGVEDLKTTVTPLILTSVKIQTDGSLGKGLTEAGMIAKEESTITTKAIESSESTSDISFQKTDVTKAFKAVPETTETPFTTSTLKPTELKDAGITEKDLIDTADKVKSTDIGSTDFTSSEERSSKPILETTTSPDKTTFSQEDEFSESLESFTETIQTNQTVISLSKESTPFFEDEHTVSPSDVVKSDVAEKEVPTHLPQTSTTEGVQEGETTLQPQKTVTLDQTKTTDEIFKFVSTRFTEVAKETKPTTEGLFTEVDLSSTTAEPPITPKEAFTTKGPAIKALDVEISTHLPTEIKTTPKEMEISEKDELATRTSTEQAPSAGLTEVTSDIFTAKKELSTSETQTPELETLTEITGETKDISKPPVGQTLSPEIVAGVKQEDATSSTQTSLPSVTSAVSDRVDVAEEETVTEQDLKISPLVTEQPVTSTEGIEKVTEARELTGISAEGVSTITDIKKEFTISTTGSDELITKEKTETELFTKSTSLPEGTSKLFEVSRITTSGTHAAETATEAKAEEHLLTTLEPRQPEAEISSQTTPGRTITTLSSIETEPPVSTKLPPFTTSVDFKSETLATVKVPSMADETDIEAKIASLTPLIKLDLTSTISSLITSTVEELSSSVKDQKTTTSVPEESIITKESDIMTTTKPVVTGKETEISLSAEATSSPIIQPEVRKETTPSEESKTEAGVEVPSTTQPTITEQELLENITESQAESETETSPKSVTESVSEVPESVTHTPKESSTPEVAEELSTKKIITLAEEEIEAQTTQETPGPFSPRRPTVLPADEIPSVKDLESSTQKLTEPPVQKSTELPTKGFKGIETTPLPLMTTLAAAIDNGTTVLVTSRNISALQRRKGQVQPIIIQRRIEKRAIERTPVEVKGCQINGTFYEFGQTVAKSSGPCLHCLCENGGNMRCDPLKCRPQEPLLMKMNKPFFKTRR